MTSTRRCWPPAKPSRPSRPPSARPPTTRRPPRCCRASKQSAVDCVSAADRPE
jgi:hypothetical protein